MIDNESLPVSDDVQDQGPSEQELLDAVMQNSPIMDEVSVTATRRGGDSSGSGRISGR